MVKRRTPRHPAHLCVAVRPRPGPSTLCAGMLLCTALAAGGGPGAAQAQAVVQASVEAARAFDIPAGSLDAALSRFGRQAGVMISVNAEMTQGRQTRGVGGHHTAAEALRLLLAGTGLDAVRGADGAYTLRLTPPPVTPSTTPQAREAGGEMTLPEVPVRTDAVREVATGPVAGYVARRSATGTRTDTPISEVPQSISVISSTQILEQNAQTMQEALRYTAGVHADVYGLDNRGDWFNLRGGSEGSTLLDGMRMPLTGWYGVVRNEPYAFERIEVLRGPASVMAGQNGPGGVVNLVSKRPLAETRREVTVQLGEDRHRQVAADLGGALDEDGSLQYRLVALGRESDTQVKHADQERQYFAPSLTWQPDAATSLTVHAQYQHDESRNTEGFFPLEGTLYRGPAGFIPIDTFVSEPDWDAYGGHRTRFGYAFSHRFDDTWTIRHDLRHDRVKGRQRSMYANFWEGLLADGRSVNRSWAATEDESRITNADLLLEGRFSSGRLQHTLLLGMDAMKFDSSRLYWSGSAPALDVYAPVYGNFVHPVLSGATAIAGSSGDTRTRQFGLLLQDQMRIDERWVVVAGLRRDQAKNEVSNSTAESSDDTVWSKNLGLVLLAGDWSPYVSYSESFEAVGGGDIFGSAYKPKRGKQVEAGVKWSPGDERIRATAAVYRLKETNRLADDPTNPLNQIQKGEVTVQGLELEAVATLSAWDVVASYTYTDSEVSGSSDSNDPTLGKRLANVPEHMAKLWAVHTFGAYGLPQLRAGLGVRYVGKTWSDSNALVTPSNTLLDAMASWDEGAWRFALNVSNLADKTYLATCLDRGDCWFGTKRKAVASLTYRW